jgi:hypothetical protein
MPAAERAEQSPVRRAAASLHNSYFPPYTRTAFNPSRTIRSINWR